MNFSTYLSIIGVILATCFVHENHSAKILSLNFWAGKSHKITYDPLLNELAKRGHEVTVVSQVPSKKNITNLRDILTFDFNDLLKRAPDMIEMKMKGESTHPNSMIKLFSELCLETYALPELQEILNTKYDLVLHEPLFQECAAGFLHKLNTSLILITPVSAPSDIVRMLGGHSPPSFIPNIFLSLDNRMNFLERIQNFVTEVISEVMKQLYLIPTMEAMYRQALDDPSIPGVAEILKNASLTLSASHLSLGGARPFMPDVIEVGGMHMRKAQPLPKVSSYI